MPRIGWSRQATLEALFETRRRATAVAGSMMDLAGEVEDAPLPFPFDLRRSAAKAYGIADACRDAHADISSGVGWLPSRLMLPGLVKVIDRYERHYSETVSGLEYGKAAARARFGHDEEADRTPD